MAASPWLWACEPNATIPLIEGHRKCADEIATEIRDLDQIRKEQDRLRKRERADFQIARVLPLKKIEHAENGGHLAARAKRTP